MSSLLFTFDQLNHFYPQRQTLRENKFETFLVNFWGWYSRWFVARPGRFHKLLKMIEREGESLRDLTDDELLVRIPDLRRMLRSNGFTHQAVARSFAFTREVSHRKLGKRHFDVQVLGGLVLISGMVAEMETGEGKTLTATLPACTVALAGIKVHVITVNDYLAQRDAELMAPLYSFFGLSVGVVSHGQSPEERQKAYRCDITYCTNKDIVFDYLRDRLVLGQHGELQMRLQKLYGTKSGLDRLLLQGLPFAIVDEADSVLIDEARTPLILSAQGNNPNEEEACRQALSLAMSLQAVTDYTISSNDRRIELTAAGKANLAVLANESGGVWAGRRFREEMIRQALAAIHHFKKDRDYIIQDDKIQIVDEYTGRVMADRSWEQGLHQLIETKEGCKITARNETLARISYQRYFRRYCHLAGMTGTAKEVASELWTVYRRHVVRIPTNRPPARQKLRTLFCTTVEEKWQTILQSISELHEQGRPILVGTRSVAVSEYLSSLLTDAGLDHRVLNARQDKEEADIISKAGEKGRITVATNMAGRGTDIELDSEVKALGGLHVLATELHDTSRVDRQLFGRCGRQGDPGSFEVIVSREDDLFLPHNRKIIGSVAGRLIGRGGKIATRIGNLYASYAQWVAQRQNSRIRRDLLNMDESLDDAMAFSGRRE